MLHLLSYSRNMSLLLPYPNINAISNFHRGKVRARNSFTYCDHKTFPEYPYFFIGEWVSLAFICN